MTEIVYVGFDLGTAYSAAAVFDGEQAKTVPSAFGGVPTPSVVRLNSKGMALVGPRARRLLDRDPETRRREPKGLMATISTPPLPAAGVRRTLQTSSARILEARRADVEQQSGCATQPVVVTVPPPTPRLEVLRKAISSCLREHPLDWSQSARATPRLALAQDSKRHPSDFRIQTLGTAVTSGQLASPSARAWLSVPRACERCIEIDSQGTQRKPTPKLTRAPAA